MAALMAVRARARRATMWRACMVVRVEGGLCEVLGLGLCDVVWLMMGKYFPVAGGETLVMEGTVVRCVWVLYIERVLWARGRS